MQRRIKSYKQRVQPIEQAGFRKNYSTIDQLQIVNVLFEKCKEYSIEYNAVFIDYEKTYDSQKHIVIKETLEEQGIPSHQSNNGNIQERCSKD